jgi:hypothetical protein
MLILFAVKFTLVVVELLDAILMTVGVGVVGGDCGH